MDITFSIANWAGWMPGASTHEHWLKWAKDKTLTDDQEQPNVKVIPPMLRRRLSPMGRAAASVMLPLFEQYGQMPVVYVSRHGEVGRTLDMLQGLAQEEPLSPTAFSLSVHNALAGLLSIQQKSNAAITAIAAGENDLTPALLEAIGQITPEAPHVLCVFCDAPVPEFYQSQVPPDFMYAVAAVISNKPDFTLSVSKEPSSSEGNQSASPQALQLLEFLLKQEPQLPLGNWAIHRQ